MEAKPGCNAFYADSTGNGEERGFPLSTSLGKLFEVKFCFEQLV